MVEAAVSDVLVIGSGNAALCAAIAARQSGMSVIVLEKATKPDSGGNSAHTLNMRFAYRGLEDLLRIVGSSRELATSLEQFRTAYTAGDFYDDLFAASKGRIDQSLAEILAAESYDVIQWLRNIGQSWEVTQNPIAGSVPLGMAGGGYAHQQRAVGIARSAGIDIQYGVAAVVLLMANGGISGVVARKGDRSRRYHTKAVVLACGGFEGSARLRRAHLGEEWENVRLRGVPHNTGDGLEMALAVGAVPYGDWTACHAAPIAESAPRHALPYEYAMSRRLRRYGFPFGISVNVDGTRFFDEGETYRNLQYAKVGRTILRQPRSMAYQLFDAKAWRLALLEHNSYTSESPFQATSWSGLASQIGIPGAALLETIADYNHATSGNECNPLSLDGVCSRELI